MAFLVVFGLVPFSGFGLAIGFALGVIVGWELQLEGEEPDQKEAGP